MAESPKVEKEDNLEDSLSSEEWTIIYNKKESKANGASEDKLEDEVSNDPPETEETEDTDQPEQSCKNRIEQVEVGEEAGEKDPESDDVSILSDESESEQLIHEGRIERIDWQVERQRIPQSEISSNSSPDGSITSSALITCSMVALILGIIIAGQIVEFRGDEPSYSVNDDIQEKLRELIGIKEKLSELNDVIHTLDQIRVSMPEMKKIKDQMKYQKYEKKKSKYSVENYKNLKQLNIENILNLNVYDDRLKILEITYQNFCSTILKINSSSSDFENELCKTPKILSDMIIFKNNLKQAFDNTQESSSPEKRILVDVERKLDFVSESLLFELKNVFSKFSMKIQERLNKLGHEMHNRLCFLYSSGKIHDKFLNILLDKKYFLNNCNESNSDTVTMDFKSNTTRKDQKNHENKRKSYEEFKKNNYDSKSFKDNKKFQNSKEYNYNEKANNAENIDVKIKGEVKQDNNWKKNKYENKEKYAQEEKKYNKNDKFDNNYKNDYNKKNKQKFDNNSFQNNKKEFDSDKKFENNKIERDNDNKFENNKIERDNNKKFDNNNKKHGYDNKFEFNKKDYEFIYQPERKKDNEFEQKFENKRNYEYDYNEDDSKFIITLENYSDKFIKNEEKQEHKNNKEYVMKLENYKDAKYIKYQGNERRDKRDKYQSNGDWQMQRFTPESEDRRGRRGGNVELSPAP